MKGRSLAFQVHSGIQAVFRHENLIVGSMFGLEMTGLTQKGIDSLKAEMEPNLNGTLSLHAQWHKDRLARLSTPSDARQLSIETFKLEISVAREANKQDGRAQNILDQLETWGHEICPS